MRRLTSAGSSGSEERGMRKVESWNRSPKMRWRSAVLLSTYLAPDHPLHHQSMPVAPEREGLVYVHQQREEAEGLLHGGHFAIDRDEESRLHGLRRESPGVWAGVRLEDGCKCLKGLA
jgi:hypothetical protein